MAQKSAGPARHSGSEPCTQTLQDAHEAPCAAGRAIGSLHEPSLPSNAERQLGSFSTREISPTLKWRSHASSSRYASMGSRLHFRKKDDARTCVVSQTRRKLLCAGAGVRFSRHCRDVGTFHFSCQRCFTEQRHAMSLRFVASRCTKAKRTNRVQAFRNGRYVHDRSVDRPGRGGRRRRRRRSGVLIRANPS